MAAHGILVLSHDTGANNTALITFDVPAGYTLASLYANSIGTSVSASITFRVGTGGTPDAGATDYYRQTKGSTAATRADSSVLGVLANTNTGVNHSGFGHIFNLRTDAPVCAYSSSSISGAGVTRNDHIRRSITQRTQIFVVCSAGVMNSGTIYCVLKKRSNTVTTKNFAAAPATTWTVQGLTKQQSGLLVFCSHDLGVSVGAHSWASRYGITGPTIRSALYKRSEVGENGADDIAFDGEIGETGAAAGMSGFSIHYGLPEAVIYSAQTIQGQIVSSSPFDNTHDAGWLELAEEHTVWQLLGSGTIDVGTGYLAAYRV